MRLILTEPAMPGGPALSGAAKKAELATAIADRAEIDVGRSPSPQLVAAIVSAAVRSATPHWIHVDAPGPIAPQPQDAIRRLAAGLPVP